MSQQARLTRYPHKKLKSLYLILKKEFTILVVTHNMQQAARVSDHTAFLYMGKLVEYSRTRRMFTNPKEKLNGRIYYGKVRLIE
jgi:phosphate transport system ATP-binding protein